MYEDVAIATYLLVGWNGPLTHFLTTYQIIGLFYIITRSLQYLAHKFAVKHV